MTAMLASVRSPREAAAALDAGVDLIDLKDPAQGALGAVSAAVARSMVSQVNGRVPVSATIGDLPLDPVPVANAAQGMAAAGVDYVKVGIFAGGDPRGVFDALQHLAADGVHLVGVLFADGNVDLSVLHALRAAGFTGAMLDTADKRAGGLRSQADDLLLGAFVQQCRRLGLMSGLAGSLDRCDIAPLLSLAPDLLGFRGALCRGARRTDSLDPAALAAVRTLIPRQNTQRPPACRHDRHPPSPTSNATHRRMDQP